LKKTIAVLAAAFALTFGMATQASASADGPELCNSGACVWFKADGDYIYVNDYNADGHSAVAQVCSPGPSSCGYAANYLWNHQGSGTTYRYGYGTQIPEGALVYYRPCIGEWNGGGGDQYIISCSSGWTYGRA
jgi:hypothetical protein